LVLVALKCDLREPARSVDSGDDASESKRPMVSYKQGLQVAERIRALRYLGERGIFPTIVERGSIYPQRKGHSEHQSLGGGSDTISLALSDICFSVGSHWKTLTNSLATECSAMKNRGVNEAFTEAARVALQVKVKPPPREKCIVM
jgi:hypothetical protein